MNPYNDKHLEELEDELRLDKEFIQEMLFESQLNDSAYEDIEHFSHINKNDEDYQDE